MVFFMFIQFGVDFASQICRFTLCISYGKISAPGLEIFFSVPYSTYIIRRLDFVHKPTNVPARLCFVWFSFSMCFMNRTIRNILVTSGEVSKNDYGLIDLWEGVLITVTNCMPGVN